MVMEKIRLTEFGHGSGCGCKIAPAVLEEILKSDRSNTKFENLLVGYESRDDAAVMELNGDQCLISTVDFFTPIVDDPFHFGRIAAANALSDVYAMGGSPILATAILGLPVEKIPADIARQIIEGGRSICEEAGIPLAGGHSIDTLEPFFGLSVNGLVLKKNLKKNNTARLGDLLFITKPVGTGIISAAMKRGKASEAHVNACTELMSTLNRIGEKLGTMESVHAMTDVTGFGLLGHLIEMTEGSHCSSLLEYKRIPLIPGIEVYMQQFIFPDNTYRNWNAYEKKVKGVSGPEFIPLCDPQTSGGLLVAIDPAAEKEFINLMLQEKILCASLPIGKMIPETISRIEILNV
jgi:selenide,water dikinase